MRLTGVGAHSAAGLTIDKLGVGFTRMICSVVKGPLQPDEVTAIVAAPAQLPFKVTVLPDKVGGVP